MREDTNTKTGHPSFAVGLGLTFGGGVGLVFGAAFDAVEAGLVIGAGVGLVVATVFFALGSHAPAADPVPSDDASPPR